MRSIRVRLLAGALIGSTVVLSAAGFALDKLTHASLAAEFDQALLAKARSLAALVEQDAGRTELELDKRTMPEYFRVDRSEYLEVRTTEGLVLTRSASLGSNHLERVEAAADAPVFRSIRLPDGRPGRLVGIRFHPRTGNEDETERKRPIAAGPVILAVAVETAGLDATLIRIRLVLAGVSLAAILLSAGVLAWVIHRGLKPLGDLAGRIERLGETDLSARVDVPAAPSELVAVVQRLNELLSRLEAAFAREKSFTADVAHELRTPLAGLRSTLDVTLSRPREPDAYRSAMTDCLAITRQMQSMVDNLLWLARMERGQCRIDRQPVVLHSLVEDCWKGLAGRAAERRLQVAWQIDPEFVVETGREQLRQVLHNILDNAVEYTDTGGSIRIEAVSGNGLRQLRVSNTGNRLSPEQIDQVFQRFWRGDAARQSTGVHCGLGLSLSRQLIALLGGSISTECADGGVFRVTVGLPGLDEPRRS
jgi:two-component system sensor histidine kinase QseC